MNESLLNLGELAKPLTKLIESIEKAVGILYEPKRIVKKAKAEANAELIKKVGQILSENLDVNVLRRIITKENKRQINIEKIIEGAMLEMSKVKETNFEDKPEEDWLTSFFDFAQDISNENMQKIWSKLLANEVDKPGSVSRRTLYTLKLISNKEAILFNLFCSHTIKIVEENEYENRGIIVITEEGHFTFNDEDWKIKNVEIGLLQEIRLCEYSQLFLEKGEEYVIDIGENRYKVIPDSDTEIQIHGLTRIGKELFEIAQFELNKDFMKKSEEYLRKLQLIKP